MHQDEVKEYGCEAKQGLSHHMPKVGVVISMHGKNDLTRQCVDKVFENAGIECDIVVVDDGSEVMYEDDRIHVLRFNEAHGNTHSMNAGIAFFDNNHKYIVNLDNDAFLEPDAIKNLVTVMDFHPEVAIAGSARFTKDDDGVMRLMGQGVDLHGGANSLDEADITTYLCHWTCGCSVIMRTSVIREIGMFDKRFKNYCQDSEWCLRAMLNDYKVALVCNSKVRHLGAGTLTAEGSTIEADRRVLLRILSCAGMNEILDKLPLEYAKNKYGRVTFNVYTKIKEGKTQC